MCLLADVKGRDGRNSNLSTDVALFGVELKNKTWMKISTFAKAYIVD